MTAFSVNRLIRNNVTSLKPYSSARDEFDGQGEDYIFLDANENPYPVVTSLSLGNLKLNRYPDPYQNELKQKISKLQQVEPSKIFISAGLDQAIEHLIRAFCEPGQDNILINPPTFGMYQVAAEINDVQVMKIPLQYPSFDLDVEAISDKANEKTKIIFICSPNNPTGDTVSKEKIRRILQNFHGLVVVDEAYIDFCPQESLLSELDKYPNLLVMQTFSKAWGLTSARLGRTFCSPEIVGILNKVKDPYNIPSLTIQAGLLALENENRKNQIVKQLIEDREKLKSELLKLPVVTKIFPSESNFLLVETVDAGKVYNFLIREKIVVRNRTAQLNCNNCLRITIGTGEENQKLLDTLSKFEV
jgi:histidinol-phosphate aminotransferase